MEEIIKLLVIVGCVLWQCLVVLGCFYGIIISIHHLLKRKQIWAKKNLDYRQKKNYMLKYGALAILALWIFIHNSEILIGIIGKILK